VAILSSEYFVNAACFLSMCGEGQLETPAVVCTAGHHMKANKSLVPTRNGEAPLLAAQRRR
jgi:hypothetical protein